MNRTSPLFVLVVVLALCGLVAEVAGEIVALRDMKPLADWIKDTASAERGTRTLAIGALGDFGKDGLPAIPTLRQLLSSKESSDRRWALDSLLRIYQASFEVASPAKTDEEWRKDIATGANTLPAVYALSKTATDADADALAGALSADDPCVRCFALDGLKRVAINTIAGCDGLSAGERRRTIVDRRTALAHVCMEKLIGIARDSNPYLRCAAIDTLGQFGFGTVVGEFGELAGPAMPVFVEALKTTDPELQYHSACALGTMGPAAASAVPSLIECAEAEERARNVPQPMDYGTVITPGAPRRLCIQALGGIGPGAEAALPMVLRALSDQDAEIRKTATQALVRIKIVPESIPLLTRNLTDSNWEVRAASASTLARAGEGGAIAVPALTSLLADGEELPRFCAVVALRDLAPHSKSALPALRKAVNDGSASVRIAAREAVHTIEAATENQH